MRTFFCLYCRRKEATEDGKPPIGWLSLSRIIEGMAWNGLSTFERLGLFCSLRCLLQRRAVIALEIGETIDELLPRSPATVGVVSEGVSDA
jgi:hypothetical protein